MKKSGRAIFWVIMGGILCNYFIVSPGSVFAARMPNGAALEYRYRGYQAQETGMLIDALAFYRKAIELDSASSCLYNDTGIVYEMLGKPDMAQEAYRKAISLEPDYINPYYNIALLYEARGDLLSASEYWFKLIHLVSPDDLITGKALQRLYEIGKMFPRVKEKYLKLEASSLNDDVLFLKGNTPAQDSAKDKIYSDALRFYLNSQEQNPL